jgi:VIT1/CCC1 family predicted Fe2+/Mn2+ transporter
MVTPRRRHGPELHRSNRAAWLRAAVLGANDGIVSVAALLVGVLGGDASFGAARTAGIAGLAAGALSMAAGEYVSVAAQRDSEEADLRREASELEEHPASELAELAQIWRERGLDAELAEQVARQLTEADALGAHARDELGITELTAARPWQAAGVSVLAFGLGGGVPFVSLLAGPSSLRAVTVMIVASLSLALSGALGAGLGGAPRWRATFRVVAGGILAMAVTLTIGELTGAALS